MTRRRPIRSSPQVPPVEAGVLLKSGSILEVIVSTGVPPNAAAATPSTTASG